MRGRQPLSLGRYYKHYQATTISFRSCNTTIRSCLISCDWYNTAVVIAGLALYYACVRLCCPTHPQLTGTKCDQEYKL